MIFLVKLRLLFPLLLGYSLPPTWDRFRQKKRQSNREWQGKTARACIGSHTFLIDGSWLLPTKRLFRSAANFDFHDNRPKMADLKSVYSSSLVHIPTPHTIQVLSSRSIVYIIVTQSFYASITSYLKKSVSSDYEVFGRVSISVFADADICMISQWTCLILSSLCMLFNWLICWPLKIPNTWNITVIPCMQWHLIC